MPHRKLVACFLCLTLLAGAAVAQEGPSQNSERLKKKIDSVGRIYRQTLSRQYEEYVASLRQDIAGLRDARAAVGDAASAAARQLDAGIEKLNKELAEAEARAAALRAEAQEELAEARPEESAAPRAEESAEARAAAGTSATGQEAQTPEGCGNLPADKLPPGAIWCGVGTALRVQDLAERAAPILWFSPNEPLKRRDIPEALPGDTPADSRTAYYRISRIIDGGSANKGFRFDTDELALTSLDEVTVRYYFYYSEDKGLNPHRNDLESLRLDIGFKLLDAAGNETKADADAPPQGARYVAHVKTAVGAAHGVSWFNNQLDIGEDQRDVSLPLTILVEEGKHATSPDRNADGFYSPGYDVNRRYNDAWGVRDLIGSGELGGVKYEGSMTKPRRPEDRVMVAAADKEALLRPYNGAYKKELHGAPTYSLRSVRPDLIKIVAESEKKKEADLIATNKQSAQQKAAKPIDVKKEMGMNIVGLMERENFEKTEPHKTAGPGLLEMVAKKGLKIERGEEALDALTMGLRYDGQVGFTMSPPVGRYDVPYLGGYVLPKINVMPFGPEKRMSVEGLYTPSAARSFDWYVSAGPEWFRPLDSREYDARFVSEGGLRFRFDKKLHFGGRLGLRTTGFRQPRNPRIVFEFGTGAF
jgi:hypothetical protein